MAGSLIFIYQNIPILINDWILLSPCWISNVFGQLLAFVLVRATNMEVNRNILGRVNSNIYHRKYHTKDAHWHIDGKPSAVLRIKKHRNGRPGLK